MAQEHQTLEVHRSRKNTIIKKIQKLAGSLNFRCAAIPVDKVFIANLYKLTRTPAGEPKQASHHRRIPKSVYEDLLVFRTFLVECAQEKYRSIPFLVKQKYFNEELQLFADASGARLNGFGCVYRNKWAWGTWAHTTIFNQITPNIALLELFAIVVAVEIWAPQLAGKAIVLRSDNTATVAYINTMKSEIPACQKLLKHMSLNCLHYQLFFKVVHVRGVENTLSDLLSRGKQSLLRSASVSGSMFLPASSSTLASYVESQ